VSNGSDDDADVNERRVEQRDLTVALNEQIDSLSVEVSSSDRSVRVQVDGWGALTGLWLDERAYRSGADALAAQIVEIGQAAAKLVADRQAFLLNEFGSRARRIHEEPE
jgi:YbaB/EbfC DNA-binding family protein